MTLPASAIPASPLENEPANAAYESAETLALMARRRSTKVGRLSEPGPSGDQIDALLRLAARVPDHGKLGPWRFVVIAGEARARAGDKLAQVIAGNEGVDETRLAAARGLFARAPACVMVVSIAAPHPKIPEWEQMQSAAMASFSLLLGAHAMGFAGCILTEWPTYDTHARASLGLTEQERIAGFVYLGTALDAVTERVRADVSTRVTRF